MTTTNGIVSSKTALGVQTIAVALMVFAIGCSVDNTPGSGGAGGTSGADENEASPNSPWAEGEDCRNWGCLEKSGASQFAIAPPSNATSCTSGATCPSGFCVDGVCCNSECAGTCQACTAAKKGNGNDGECGNIALYGDPDNECPKAACNGEGACESYNGVPCMTGTECLSGHCVDGVCCGASCTETCRACSKNKTGGDYDGQCRLIPLGSDPDNECATSECNGVGTCIGQNQLNGLPCTSPSQCASGYCVDNYCCGNACTAACMSCSAQKKGSGSNGSCGSIAANTDPDDECGEGYCNGSSSCAGRALGSACTDHTQCAQGNCVDGVCCDSACSGVCEACTAVKKGSGADGTCGFIAAATNPDKECVSGRCSGSGTCQYFNGHDCTDAAQCMSGYCVDGFCCGNACTGPCRACSVAKRGSGSNGQCGPIAAGTDPDNECGGFCDGAGLCTNTGLGDVCSSASQCPSGFCVNGICCENACTAMDQCHVGVCAAGTGTCTNEPKTNGTSCDDASNCTLGDSCQAGVCTGTPKTCPGGGTCNNGVCSSVGFAPKVDYAVGDGPYAVAAGDLNGDGFIDLAFANENAHTISVLLNHGNGTFAAKVDYSTGTYPNAIVARDLNGDGRTDLALTSRGGGALCIMLNAGSGTFPTKNCNYVGGGVSAIAAGDVNGDGFIDLATANTNNGMISVCWNDGLGNFWNTTTIVVGSSPAGIAIGDLNGNGLGDVAVANAGSNYLSVIWSTGNKTFAPTVVYQLGARPLSITSADLNGDGFADLAYGINSTLGTIGTIGGNGNSTLGPRNTYTAGSFPKSIAVGDVNGDGFVDLAVANYGANSVSVLRSLGNGLFAPSVNFAVGTSPESVASADLNGDGFDDLAIANYGDDTVSILLSLASP